ncbi:MAG: NADH-quinone oxidoreductase subunit L [Planctomycetes bacterium]|nr:NADH-quinone oxidoreductase subunit L [Planctomycetota bacterium]
MEENLLELIILIPFASVVVQYFLHRVLPARLAGLIACGAVLVPFLLTVVVGRGIGAAAPQVPAVTATIASWLTGGGLEVAFGLRLDPLSCAWTLVVTGIGFLIHVYSLGYMHHDPGFKRFFIYMNLFIGSMLALVLGDSLPLLFLGWEGVGLCSYLLIGFWFEDMNNARAGQKAFVVNRIGDLGFLLAMLMIFQTFGTLDIAAVTNGLSAGHAQGTFALGDARITLIALLLFVGACGKSAQLPLFVWLPDAMAGPTPVSALIHAATMVTAGIYMVARFSVFFALAPVASAVVAIVGALTAFVSATIALRQRDIKKVLAYSTCSQLGYMFLGLGVGAYGAAVFHVVTHAFFKALLFLGAGSVIHALSHEQNAMKMGGLKPHLPRTHWTFFVGCFALAGIFPFAGFFSKDKILGEALLGHGWLFPLVGVLGLITALMTAFYTFRLYRLVFTGPERLDAHAKKHLHESPATMTVPLVILALLSIGGGALSLPAFAHFDILGDYLRPIFAPALAVAGEAAHHAVNVEVALMLVSLAVVIGGAWWAWNRFARGPGDQLPLPQGGLPFLLENKWFVDEIYAIFVVGPMRGTALLAGFFDRYVIDGIVNGLARLCDLCGAVVRLLQNGAVHTYALLFIAGAVYLVCSLL